jgi:hypothetical protein
MRDRLMNYDNEMIGICRLLGTWRTIETQSAMSALQSGRRLARLGSMSVFDPRSDV